MGFNGNPGNPKGIVDPAFSQEVDPYLWIPSGPLDHEVSLRYVLLEDADHERPNLRWLSSGVTCSCEILCMHVEGS